jgi:hypothetical protein
MLYYIQGPKKLSGRGKTVNLIQEPDYKIMNLLRIKLEENKTKQFVHTQMYKLFQVIALMPVAVGKRAVEDSTNSARDC